MVSDNVFPCISLCKTCDPHTDHFWHLAHNLNKLGRGPLGDDTYKISRLNALWFQTRFFDVFHYISVWKTSDPQGWGHFWPHGHNLNTFGRGHTGDAT